MHRFSPHLRPSWTAPPHQKRQSPAAAVARGGACIRGTGPAPPSPCEARLSAKRDGRRAWAGRERRARALPGRRATTHGAYLARPHHELVRRVLDGGVADALPLVAFSIARPAGRRQVRSFQAQSDATVTHAPVGRPLSFQGRVGAARRKPAPEQPGEVAGYPGSTPESGGPAPSAWPRRGLLTSAPRPCPRALAWRPPPPARPQSACLLQRGGTTMTADHCKRWICTQTGALGRPPLPASQQVQRGPHANSQGSTKQPSSQSAGRLRRAATGMSALACHLRRRPAYLQAASGSEELWRRRRADLRQ